MQRLPTNYIGQLIVPPHFVNGQQQQQPRQRQIEQQQQQQQQTENNNSLSIFTTINNNNNGSGLFANPVTGGGVTHNETVFCK